MQVEQMRMSKVSLGNNSRLNVEQSELSELMASIKEVGFLQPIGVTRKGEGFEVCYGNRRYLAAQKLGLRSIPVVVHSSEKQADADILNLTENLQRKNISLAEAGRYMTDLGKQGITAREIAARLGFSVNFVKSALTAYNEVPTEFREDLEIPVPGKKQTTGKISFTSARAILNAKRTYSLNPTQTRKLFKAAKTKTAFAAVNVPTYAGALKAGKRDFTKANPIHSVHMKTLISETEWQRLTNKYVDTKQFKSLAGVCIAILRGDIRERINVLR